WREHHWQAHTLAKECRGRITAIAGESDGVAVRANRERREDNSYISCVERWHIEAQAGCGIGRRIQKRERTRGNGRRGGEEVAAGVANDEGALGCQVSKDRAKNNCSRAKH